VPEFCNDGQWGFMAQNEDPEELAAVVDRALADKGRLREMGEAGQQFVAGRYRWEIVAGKMVHIMEQCCGATSSAGVQGTTAIRDARDHA